MAIIKFLSKIDCNLYIDTEFVSVMNADMIKKIELEVGSYLIETFDKEGAKISSQILNVEESQRQILLRLSSDSTLLADTLRKLKNDASAIFYNHRLKFKHNEKYGYVDNRYDVVILPEYSNAEDFIRDKALVKKDFSGCKKVTIIDTKGAICYDCWFDFVGEDETSILLLHDGVLTTIDKSDYSILAKYKTLQHNITTDELIPASKICGVDEMFGYISRSGKEIIPFIYDSASEFDNSGYAKVLRFGIERAVDRMGNLYVSYEAALNDGKESTRTAYSRGFLGGDESSYEEKYIYHALKISKDEAQIRDFDVCNCNFEDNISWSYTPVKIGNNWGLQEDNPWEGFEDLENTGTNEISKPSIIYRCDRIFYHIDGYIAYRIGDECKLLSISNPDKIYSYKYESIFPVILSIGGYDCRENKLSNIIVKRNGKYGLIDVNGKIVLPLEYDYIEPTKAIGLRGTIGEFGIIWKNGKCTLINLISGEILDTIQFDKIEISNYPQDELYTFESNLFVWKEGKSGCFTLRMSEKVPIIYDKIEAKYEILADGYQETLILRIGNKVGIHVVMHYVFPGTRGKSYSLLADITPEYDECVFIKNGHSVENYKELIIFAVRKSDKWGILDVHPFGAILYDPCADYEPNYKDLEFKYDSLNSLMKEFDKEFKNRYIKYYELHANNDW